MLILDFIFGGNGKVVAKKIFQLHEKYGGDYQKVYNFIINETEKELEKKSAVRFLDAQLPKFSVKNYAELGAFYLFISASPDFAKWADISSKFTPEIERYLRKMKMPENLISGNNRIS
ncbi:hypothetical protein OLZ31_26300 [Enterobacter asburiae]|nr:hypothetical protein [Enterobacter asburiae]